MERTTLARIREVDIFIEDHGMLTSFLYLDYAEPDSTLGASGQGFGGYVLGRKTSEWIEGCLKATGVYHWHELVGQYVWAVYSPSKVLRITGIRSGKTFDPDSDNWAVS